MVHESMPLAITCIYFLRDTVQLWFKYFDVFPIDKDLNLMAVENCLCEISKQLRVYQEQGKTKNSQGGTNDLQAKIDWCKKSGYKKDFSQQSMKKEQKAERKSDRMASHEEIEDENSMDLKSFKRKDRSSRSAVSDNLKNSIR